MKKTYKSPCIQIVNHIYTDIISLSGEITGGMEEVEAF